MKNFKFMSFKKGQGRYANIAIIAGALFLSYKFGQRGSQGTDASGGPAGTFTTTGSSTLAGIRKYFAPPQTQKQDVVRKSVGIYSNRG